MSDTKFTPGEWEVRMEQITASSSGCYTIATDERDVVSATLGIRSEADANLMAASKLLYDMLNECANQLSAMGANGHARLARAALAKARGEK